MTPNDELAAHRDGLQLNIHPVAVFVREGDADASPGGFFRALTVFVIVDDQDIVSVMNVSGMGFFGHVEISQVNRVMDSKAFQKLKVVTRSRARQQVSFVDTMIGLLVQPPTNRY
jgi:hypothetical protein